MTRLTILSPSVLAVWTAAVYIYGLFLYGIGQLLVWPFVDSLPSFRGWQWIAVPLTIGALAFVVKAIGFQAAATLKKRNAWQPGWQQGLGIALFISLLVVLAIGPTLYMLGAAQCKA